MDPYNHILQTKRPDKEYEYFWYNYKSHLNNIQKYNIDLNILNISEKLNILAKEKKYNEIPILINNIVVYTTKIVFYKLNNYQSKIHHSFIKKWKKIYDTNDYILFFFELYSLIIEKKNIKLLNYFKETIIDFNENNIIQLIQYCIDDKICYILHKIGHIYDVKDYIRSNHNFNSQYYDSITIEKFIKSFFETI